MKNFKALSIIVLATLGLTACGGGGGGGSDAPTPTTKTLEGKVIDGYIVGATVFLDLNFNSELDAGEPSSVTEEEGVFRMAVTEEDDTCSQYVPTVTIVPVGAIDTDFPDQPIAKAYKMVSPPSFARGTDEDLLNLTPLTSIVWDSVEKELYGEGISARSAELTCETIIAEEQLRETIAERITQQEIRVAQRYNITVDEMYGDYVATANTRVHTMAQELVPGMQASYAETLDLEDANPSANYVFVEYFLDSDWFRREFVQTSNGNYKDTIELMEADLETSKGVIQYDEKITQVKNDVETEITIRLESDDTEFATDRRCSVTESVSTLGDVRYGYANNYFDADFQLTPENCFEEVRDEAFYLGQTLSTKVMYAGTDTPNMESNHVYFNGATSGFEYLAGFDPLNLFPADLEPLNVIDTAFEDDLAYGASQWSRVEYVYETADFYSGSQTVRRHDNDDNYSVYIYNVDGTHSDQCGTWSEGDSSLGQCAD